MDLLDPLESLMLTAELVSSPMHVAVLMILSPPPGEDPEAYPRRLFEESLEADVEIDPRLRRVPRSGVDTGFGWAWRDVTDRGGTVDVRHHFQRRTLPRGSGIDALWELVSGLHAVRLDRSAPLWMVYLIDGLPNGRFALYIKVHHIVVDGVAGMQMIAGSLSPDPARRGMPPLYAANPTAAGGAHTGTRPGHRAGGLISALRGIADTATAGVGLTGRLARTELATALGTLLSRSIAAPFGAPRTRFNTKLGPFRSVAGTSLERARIRAVREVAGVTGNDVVMAVIAGALREWLQDRDELPGRSLVAICPVTVRGRGASAADRHGNQFGMGLCPLGTDLADPAERLTLVHDAMRNLKSQVAKQGPGAMLAAMGPAIGPTIALAMLPFDTGIPPSFNIPISNVPGPREQMYFNGAQVEEIYPVSTVYDGMALNVTVCSYGEQMGVGYVADRDAVGDVEGLVPPTERALTELERAVGLTT